MARVDSKWPSVTAVIATRGDRPELLREAVESIVSQEYPGVISVVVSYDRAEPDESLADGTGVIVLRSDRGPGSSGTRNAGILAAEGDLVAFCDDDDTWLPGKLRDQVAAMRRDRSVFCAAGAISVYDGWTTECIWPRRWVTFADLLRSRVKEASTPTFLADRTALLGPIGLFSEEIPGGYAEDYEFLLRAARHAPISYLNQVAVRVRVHGRSSHFDGDWETIARAHEWLLAHYPEFRTDRRGQARLAGQIAFARAMLGQRGDSVRWARRAIACSPLEPRSYIVLALAARVITPRWVLRRFAAAGIGS